MNQQPTITELIETVSQSLEADGITAEYIQQLSYTWNALKRYLSEHDLFFSKESGTMFWKKFMAYLQQKGMLIFDQWINVANGLFLSSLIVQKVLIYIERKPIGHVILENHM